LRDPLNTKVVHKLKELRKLSMSEQKLKISEINPKLLPSGKN